MADFASHNLSMFADLTVVHQTGLTGQYDRHFEATRCAVRSPGAAQLNGVVVGGDFTDPADSSADPGGESLSDAVRRQLGLKLSRASSNLEVFVIDHVGKVQQQ